MVISLSDCLTIELNQLELNCLAGPEILKDLCLDHLWQRSSHSEIGEAEVLVKVCIWGQKHEIWCKDTSCHASFKKR